MAFSVALAALIGVLRAQISVQWPEPATDLTSEEKRVEHFREGELLGFAAALTDRQAGVLAHLLACGRCRNAARPIVEQLAQTAAGAAPETAAPDLSGLWPRVAARWQASAAAVAEERRAAGPVVEELLARPPEERAFYLRGEERLHTIAAVLTLLERGARAAEREPQTGEEMARLALLAAQRLPREAAARDLQSEAWTLVGYALQRRGDSPGAELAFRTASDLLEDQDSFEAATLARRLAAFRRLGKRPLEALALYQRAVTLFEECGEATLECLALEEQATLYAELGDLERAVTLLSRAFMLSNRVADAATALSGRLMLAQLLLRFDRAEQAEAVLARAEAEGVEDAGLRAILGVTRAQAAALAGRADEAERRLVSAFEEALAARATAAAAVAGIHLASLAIWRGRRRDLVRFAPRLAPLVRSRDLPVRARAALRRLRNAAAAGTADRKLAAEVWRETLAALPASSLRAGLLMLTGQVLTAGPPDRKG